jgi:hypothetical protein
VGSQRGRNAYSAGRPALKPKCQKKPLSAAALANLRAEHARTIDPARALSVEALTLETEVSALVNEAYGLTSRRSRPPLANRPTADAD